MTGVHGLNGRAGGCAVCQPGDPGTKGLTPEDLEIGNGQRRSVQTDLLHPNLRPRPHGLGGPGAKWGDAVVDGDHARGQWLMWVAADDGHDPRAAYLGADIAYIRTPGGWRIQSIVITPGMRLPAQSA